MKSVVSVLIAGGVLATASVSFADSVVYNSLPAPRPDAFNVVSQAYQAQQMDEFGDEVTLAGTDRRLGTVTVGLSDWAKRSDYMTFNGVAWTQNNPNTGPMDQNGFTVPLTFNIYSVAAGPATGTLLATETINGFVPWRPETSPTSPDGTQWLSTDGNYYHGLYTTVSFDFSSLNVTLPNTIIYGLYFNTQTWGNNPTGVAGPYTSLNFALSDLAAPSVGTDVDPNAVFLNSQTASNYGGGGPVGTFSQATGWSNNPPAVQITAVPLPSSVWVGFAMLGGFGSLFAARKRLSRHPRIA